MHNIKDIEYQLKNEDTLNRMNSKEVGKWTKLIQFVYCKPHHEISTVYSMDGYPLWAECYHCGVNDIPKKPID